jgi:copper oxidase (laccase) domain-containing protein
MPFHLVDGIKYYTFNILDELQIKHAVFTRHGGVSPNPWYSLNFGSLVGDDPQRVLENHKRAFQALQCDLLLKYDVWQVHSADVVIAEAPRPFSHPIRKLMQYLRKKTTLPYL